ncbi:hypothetical protein NDU88_009933 [Pleurodeles waltl]|uniref:Uncharacterized protein n=1 Tax=Pleurodeles waltl TaxID=8319 RepID=A0AAV7S2F9_PLEWA|nr:hypothetical protein NDU88_009933 [Pleurodeles waltl]
MEEPRTPGTPIQRAECGPWRGHWPRVIREDGTMDMTNDDHREAAESEGDATSSKVENNPTRPSQIYIVPETQTGA